MLDLEPLPEQTGGGEDGGGETPVGTSHVTIAPVDGVLTLPDAYTIIADLTADVTQVHFPAVSGDRRVVVYLRQAGAGGRALTGWPAAIIWPEAQAPQVSQSPGAVDCLVFDVFDSGAVVFGNVVGLGYGPAQS